jgi:hypothetical protein
MAEPEMCHCGRPLHYTDPVIERMVRALIRDLGDYMNVTVEGRTWLVQRHYIALHGIKAVELPFLGFEEITGYDRRAVS